MKRHPVLAISVMLVVLPAFLYASDFKISLKGGALLTVPVIEILGTRELFIEYALAGERFPLRSSIRIIQDSYDDFIWGESTRWGGKWIIGVSDGPVRFRAGPGVSLTSTHALKNQISGDLYLEMKFSVFSLEIDSLFFKDGMFIKNSIGLEFSLGFLGRESKIFLGIGGIANSDYSDLVYFPGLIGGLNFAF